MHLDERTGHRPRSLLILHDLLIFLFHPLHLGRPAPARSERDRCRSANTRLLGVDARYFWDAVNLLCLDYSLEGETDVQKMAAALIPGWRRCKLSQSAARGRPSARFSGPS
jgi:hypothetical protein